MGRQVVTATWLEDLYRTGSPIAVASDALITPAARDWLKDRGTAVRYLNASSNGHGDGRYGLVLNEQQAVHRSMAMNLESKFGCGQRFVAEKDASSVVSAVRAMCGAIQRGTFSHGVVLTEEGSLPACFANKQNGIRAAMVDSLATVSEAIRAVGINVMVVETPRQTYHQIRQVVDRFLKSSGHVPEAMAGVFNEVEAG
jgi:ribose 5-phosphate isomerase RpiB